MVWRGLTLLGLSVLVVLCLIDTAAPPGFFVALQPEITVVHAQFVSSDVIVRWEICRSWCDHPFRNDVGIAGDSWRSVLLA